VDTGCPHTAEEAVKFIEDMKLSVNAVFLTHYHEDHSGGAYLFKEKFDVDVFAPEKSLEILANPQEFLHIGKLFGVNPNQLGLCHLKPKWKLTI
jgi:glyoxylase-like metal-dependent hydrolase (beta-lactamase superfamily II)